MTAIEKYLLGLKRRAHSDWISARLLWNLGFVVQAVWLIQQSVEKYLKALWVRDEKFTSEKELEKKLKKIGRGKFDSHHDLSEIFDKLNPEIRARLGIPKILQVKSEVLRYGGSFVYGDKLFSNAEAFIKRIRTLLGDDIKPSLYKETKCTFNKQCTETGRQKYDKIIKEILSLKNKMRRKELLKQIKQRFVI